MAKPKVVVIDDEQSICDILEKFLNKKGFEVIPVNESIKGIEVVRREKVDVVICDIKMPNLDGISVLQEIKRIDKDVPVLIITGFPAMDTAVKALQLGAFDYLTKPINLDEIGQKIERAIFNRKILEENVLFSKIVSLHEVSKSLATIHDQEELVSTIFDYSMRLSKASAGILILLNDKNEPEIAKTTGMTGKLESKDNDYWKAVKWVIMNETPLFIEGDNPSVPLLGKMNIRGIKSSITFPLKSPKKILGALMLNRAEKEESFSNIDLEAVNVLASQAAISLDNVQVYDALRDQHLQTILAFARAVEAKDPYTRGHSENVMKYSIALGERLKLNHDRMDALKYGSLLHDVGKIGVDEVILNKPGKLAPVEFEKIKQHPEMGCNIVADITSMSEFAPLIHYHHEYHNGSGYPEGLSEDEIPYEAKIVTLADAFDAMTSNRTYRRSMPKEKALSIIESELGKQFDPDLGKIFIELMKQNDIQ